MFAFLVRRILSGFLIVVLVSLAVFTLFFYGPKSPALELCRRDTNNRCGPTSPKLEVYEERLGYNNPMLSEYGKWAKGLVVDRTITIGTTALRLPGTVPRHLLPRPDLGHRPAQGPVSRSPSAWPSAASSLYLLIGVTVGVLAARRRGTTTDKALVSVHPGLQLDSLLPGGTAELPHRSPSPPASSRRCSTPPSSTTRPSGSRGLLLVWLVMGLYGSTSYTRFSRGAMVESLGEDYVRTARAKGLRTRTVVVRHALRSALVPVATIFGLDFAFLLSGTRLHREDLRSRGHRQVGSRRDPHQGPAGGAGDLPDPGGSSWWSPTSSWTSSTAGSTPE